MGFDFKTDTPCANCIYRMRRPEDKRYMFSTYWVCAMPAEKRIKNAKNAAIGLAANLRTIDKFSEEGPINPMRLENWQDGVTDSVNRMNDHLDNCRMQLLQGWTEPCDHLICPYKEVEKKPDVDQR